MKEINSILVVDNDESVLSTLKERIIMEGYTCEVTTGAVSALELLEKRAFDTMITDIVMPGMKGLELTERAKKIRPDLNVIIMTGYINEFSFDDAMKSGASDFITKPFTLTELMMRIKHVQHQENLRLMAVTDELTGLYNRRGFFMMAEHQLKMANRQGSGIYVLYADMDNMKKINDHVEKWQSHRNVVFLGVEEQ